MKHKLAPYCLVFVALMSLCSGLNAQDLFGYASRERIEACTDRTLYVSGEQIQFTVRVYQTEGSPQEEFSRVFYCELISPDGNRIAGGKYLLKDFSGEGSLTIPEETISGIYFLKFYTRFMRNISTGAYQYILVKIVNPFKTEVLSGDQSINHALRPEQPVNEGEGNPSLTLLSGKKRFSPREQILLSIQADHGNKSSSELSLTVIPESAFDDLFLPEMNTPIPENNGVYFPETRGISLSGQLIGKEAGNPLPGAKVYLSIIGDKNILVDRTDSIGRFFFALPDYYGYKDIFLCAEDLPDVTPELFIDNDFCSRPVSLPSLLFTLNKEEMKAAYNLAVNFRITGMFGENQIESDTLEESTNTLFYGKPSEILFMEKYIDLPTLEEYFTELTVNVKIKKEQGRKRFRFLTTLADMSTYDPLVMVDWVAVDNMEKILSMSPLAIDRIELVNAPYIKGDITYGGIISFVSKENDFAGIDLPTSGTFLNYPFLEEITTPVQTASLPENIPDSRNTIYWNPAVQTDDNGTAKISFTAPDTPGNYIILLREMTPAGEVVLMEEKFVVEGN